MPTSAPMVSSPILGTMRFGDWGARLSPVEVARLLATAADLGIDTLDLADIYGEHTTNALIGATFRLDPTLRRRFALIAKIGIVRAGRAGNPRGVAHYNLDPTHLRAALDETLTTLGVERVDMVMLHRFDPLLRPADIADWVETEREAGRVAAFGVSNFNAHALALFDRRPTIAANQIELSLAHGLALENGDVDATRARGAQVQAWSPLGGGALLDASSAVGQRLHPLLRAMAAEFALDPAGLLLRWVATIPDTRVVLGTARSARLADAVRACASPLPHDAWYALWEAARGHAVP